MAIKLPSTSLLLAILSLCALSGCLGGFGDGPSFVDETLIEIQDPFDADVGEFCRGTGDCLGGLRCVNAEGDQFCVDTCQSGGTCDQGDCNLAANDDSVGWCGLDGVGDELEDFDEGSDGGGRPDERPPVVEGGPSTPSGDCGSAVEREQLRLTNADRSSQGLPALRCDPRLAEVARAHSRDMAVRDFFDHTNPDGEQPWDRMRRHGIRDFSSAGENIAYGYPTAEAVEEGWMDSPGHRANILGRDYTHLGVGVFDDGGTLYWTQVFASF